MRPTFTLVCVLLSLPALAFGQEVQSTRAQMPGLGPIGLPLPTIGLPLPAIGLGPVPDRRIEPAPTEAPRTPRRRGSRARSAIVYVVPAYPWAAPSPLVATPTAAPGTATASPHTVPETGRLYLDVQPAAPTQLFVDEVFVGTIEDLRRGIDLEPGVRRLEFRAQGYEVLSVNVQVDPARDITYRAVLHGTAPPPAALDGEPPPADPIAIVGNRTMYEIPGCYMGNVPPEDVHLPAGCDPARVRVYTP